MSEEMSPAYKASMHFIGGTLGGMTGVAASYPLDTVKVSILPHIYLVVYD